MIVSHRLISLVCLGDYHQFADSVCFEDHVDTVKWQEPITISERGLVYNKPRKNFWGYKKLQGGRQNGYKGRQLNVWWWETIFGSDKPIRKTKKKWRPFFILETVKILYFVGAPFELNGRAPFKLVTPMLDRRGL